RPRSARSWHCPRRSSPNFRGLPSDARTSARAPSRWTDRSGALSTCLGASRILLPVQAVSRGSDFVNGLQASASIFVSATCGRTPNASLHLWGQCRRQVLQFCIFQLVCLDGGFSPARGRLLCSKHSEKSGRDRGRLDRRLSIQTSCNSSRDLRPRVLPAPVPY